MKKRILIVEDEEKIVSFIKNRLDNDIYEIDIALDGKEALKRIYSQNYDLITLDVLLPFFNGFDICKEIRTKSSKTLIIMISAIDEEDFKIKGYEFGIDDYISKPFSSKELALKIKSLLKRREELLSLSSQFIPNIIVDDNLKKILINGFEINFTPSEYIILHVLILNKNRVYSRRELAQVIYDSTNGEIDEIGINSHIYHIREKVKQFYDKDIIKTIRGMGYKINEN
jgi:DNA-binding response OmpR family regulator